MPLSGRLRALFWQVPTGCEVPFNFLFDWLPWAPYYKPRFVLVVVLWTLSSFSSSILEVWVQVWNLTLPSAVPAQGPKITGPLLVRDIPPLWSQAPWTCLASSRWANYASYLSQSCRSCMFKMFPRTHFFNMPRVSLIFLMSFFFLVCILNCSPTFLPVPAARQKSLQSWELLGMCFTELKEESSSQEENNTELSSGWWDGIDAYHWLQSPAGFFDLFRSSWIIFSCED